MDTESIKLAIQALGGLRTIASGLVAVRDLSKLGALQVEMNQRIIEAQSGLLDLQAELAAQRAENEGLKRECARLKTAAADREQYELVELRKGAFAYKSKGESTPHFLCQPCYDKGVKSVLQLQTVGSLVTQVCPVCETKIRISGSQSLTVPLIRG